MTDTEIFQESMKILKPWVVVRVDMDKERKRFDIYIDLPEGTKVQCPQCGKRTPLHDKREERVWRALDSGIYQTYLHCRIPRCDCEKHGVKTVEIPWSISRSHYTESFESKVIDVLKATKNRKATASLMGLSWHEANGVMMRATARGLARRGHEKIDNLGIDEKSFLRGQSYAAVLTDADNRRILDVVENRDKEAVKRLFGCLNEEQRKNVKAISMDFWQAFISVAQEKLPNAKIVHDKFHIMKYINEAVNSVRAGEHKWRKKQKDATLTGTKYLWLKKLENFTDKDKERWAELKLDQLEVGKAWNLRELFAEFWNSAGITAARKLFKSWYYDATHSALEPMIKVAKMLKEHLDNIVTWFRHPITNSFAEGINSVIQEIKTVARGFRNFENYRGAILFFCGDLSLYPHKSA